MSKNLLRSLLLIAITLSGNAYAVYPQPVTGHKGMVVSEHYLASQIGINILRQGGNAIDAAVAVGYALAVVNPCCGNIGGGGFMLIHLANGKDIFINFREKAPLAATANMYLDKNGNVIPNKSLFGYSAVAVPGTVLGLDTALQKFGTMKRQQVMAPAIKLAEQGFVLTPNDIDRLYHHYNSLQDFKNEANVAAIFLKNNQPYASGDRLVQKNLSQTLKKIEQTGSHVFYHGIIAEQIAKASQANGGILSLKDFTHYNIQELQPINCTYRGYKITSAPPPSSGGIVLCEILNILEGYPLHELGFHSSQSVHYMAEAMLFSYKDRNNKLGDPDFIKNPTEQLISKEYAAQIRKQIQTSKATPNETKYKPSGPELVETTHYSVTDKDGNAVAVTYTLNGWYGARVIAGNTGFFLNQEMDDFTSKVNSPNLFGLVQGPNNSIAPGKRPLSSMSPTIVTKNNQLFMVLGSPGGSRIITSIAQTLINVIDYDMDIKQAVNETRFHHQWLPNKIDYEAFALSKDTLQNLENMGYTLKQQANWSCVEAITFDPLTHIYYGATDDRRPLGSAVGY